MNKVTSGFDTRFPLPAVRYTQRKIGEPPKGPSDFCDLG
ncbi:MAG: hypothetical protein JWL97_1728, partial [Gemmatimonadales bacterium]|nr:hypothetical protein [Gemmatimonadales bacterium]